MNDPLAGYGAGHADATDKYLKEVATLRAEGGRYRAALEKTAELMRKMGTKSGQTISTGWVLNMAESALPPASGKQG